MLSCLRRASAFHFILFDCTGVCAEEFKRVLEKSGARYIMTEPQAVHTAMAASMMCPNQVQVRYDRATASIMCPNQVQVGGAYFLYSGPPLERPLSRKTTPQYFLRPNFSDTKTLNYT